MRPASGRMMVQHHAHRGGLAGAIAAQEAENAAFGHAEAEAVHGSEIAEALHYLIQNQHGHVFSPVHQAITPDMI